MARMPDITLSRLPWCTAGFLVGVYTMTYFSAIPSWSLALILLPLIPLSLRWQKVIPLIFVVAGFTWMAWSAEVLKAQAVPEDYIGNDVHIIGYATGLPDIGDRTKRYSFRVLHMWSGTSQLSGGLIRLSDYRRQSQELQPGKAWHLNVRLKPASGFANPGGFDYERWLFSQRIASTGYIRKSEDNQRVSEFDRKLPVTDLRMHVANAIHDAIGESEFSGLITALAVGDKREISQQQWEILRQTGTAHLMAISGLHVGLVAMLAFWLGRAGWTLWPKLSTHFPAHKAAMLFALVAASLYSLLAGFTLPTQRALIMLVVFSIAFLMDRRIRSVNILSLTLLLVLLRDPLAVLSAGFWLSFGAVAMIFYGLLYQHRDNRFSGAARMQLRLSIMLAPLTLLMFDQFSIISPLANGLAIPVVAFVVVPVVLLAVCLLVMFGSGSIVILLLKLAASVLSGMWPVLQVLADLEAWADLWSIVSSPMVLASFLMVMLLVLPAGLRLRQVSLICVLAAVAPYQNRMEEGEVRLLLMDVGQGLSMLVQTRDHVLIFDTGARFSAAFNAGDAVVLPVLKHEGLERIDTLLVSHGDNDHIGGARAILQGIEVDRLLTNERINGYSSWPCVAGESWTWNQVRFRVLHPRTSENKEGNNASCVLQVLSPYGSILLPADIEKEAESLLIENFANDLKADILIAPHHGSRSSSSRDFLDKVAPDLVLVPAGWHNRYRHPSEEVIRRTQGTGASLINTADCGAIEVMLTGTGREVTTWRMQTQRLWQRYVSPSDCGA